MFAALNGTWAGAGPPAGGPLTVALWAVSIPEAPSDGGAMTSRPPEAGPAAAAGVLKRSPALPAELTELVATGSGLAANRHAAATQRAYLGDFGHFDEWCKATAARSGFALVSLPAEPETVWLYLSALVEADNAAGYRVSTLERRLSAIKWVHDTSGYPSPTSHTRVRELMAGIRRTYGARPERSDPITTDQLTAMVDALDLNTLAGLRDRAVLLVGYAGAFRRSELAGMRREQLRRTGDGYIVELGRTKDDQEAKGRDVGIPAFAGSALCPVTAVDAWLAAAAISGGPIFRRVTRYQTIGARALSADAVAKIVKRAAAAAGIPPDRLSGHSLRAGHATTAAQNGAPDRTIMRQTGHKRTETLDNYVRPATVFVDNSADYLDLAASTPPAGGESSSS